MIKCIVVAALSAILFCGCPAGGFFGRYLVINNTGSTASNLTLAVAAGTLQTWDETQPNQGWIHQTTYGAKSLTVSWIDDTGPHTVPFSFESEVGYRSHADLMIELKPHGELSWRIIEPSAEDGKLAIAWLVPAYVLYCLGVAFVVGLPLSLAAITAYGMFSAIRTAAVAVVQGLYGDRTVFQFTIREILMLTTMVALSFGWIIHYWAAKQ